MDGKRQDHAICYQLPFVEHVGGQAIHLETMKTEIELTETNVRLNANISASETQLILLSNQASIMTKRNIKANCSTYGCAKMYISTQN